MKEEESGDYPGCGQTLVLLCCQDCSGPGLFPGSPPRLGAGRTGNSKNPRWVINSLEELLGAGLCIPCGPGAKCQGALGSPNVLCN